jgi:hypothetical protein
MDDVEGIVKCFYPLAGTGSSWSIRARHPGASIICHLYLPMIRVSAQQQSLQYCNTWLAVNCSWPPHPQVFDGDANAHQWSRPLSWRFAPAISSTGPSEKCLETSHGRPASQPPDQACQSPAQEAALAHSCCMPHCPCATKTTPAAESLGTEPETEPSHWLG